MLLFIFYVLKLHDFIPSRTFQVISFALDMCIFPIRLPDGFISIMWVAFISCESSPLPDSS